MSEVINIKELNERIERESVFVDTLRAEMSKVIVGQTHLIDTLLIGLLSKTAILITEYAADRRAEPVQEVPDDDLDEDEEDDRDSVAEALIRWVPPITAIVCAAVALCGFVYYQFML